MRNTTGHQNQDGALVSKQSQYLGLPRLHGCTSAPTSWFQAHDSFILRLRVGARVCMHFMVQFSKICKEDIIWTPWNSSKHVSPSRHFRRMYFLGIIFSGWAQHRTGCVGPGPPCPSTLSIWIRWMETQGDPGSVGTLRNPFFHAPASSVLLWRVRNHVQATLQRGVFEACSKAAPWTPRRSVSGNR